MGLLFCELLELVLLLLKFCREFSDPLLFLVALLGEGGQSALRFAEVGGKRLLRPIELLGKRGDMPLLFRKGGFQRMLGADGGIEFPGFRFQGGLGILQLARDRFFLLVRAVAFLAERFHLAPGLGHFRVKLLGLLSKRRLFLAQGRLLLTGFFLRLF